MSFDMIAFDADDTLWHTETFYREVEGNLLEILGRYGLEAESALREFHKIEIANLPDFGYGIKGFLISMLEAAAKLTSGRLRGEDVLSIIELGRGMVRHEINLLPGVDEVVPLLAGSKRLALITKGDLMDQERKITLSGLEKYFNHIEIVSDKTPDIYAGLLEKLHIAPERFLMIGNSIRSDILPVLALGGWAVFVPYADTWAHEATGDLPSGSNRFFEIAHLGELPGLVNRIESFTTD